MAEFWTLKIGTVSKGEDGTQIEHIVTDFQGQQTRKARIQAPGPARHILPPLGRGGQGRQVGLAVLDNRSGAAVQVVV